MAETVSLVEQPATTAAGSVAQLVIALRSDRPAEPASRHVLDGTHEGAPEERQARSPRIHAVELGRGKRRATRSGSTVRTLALAIPDPAMSERHARLTRLRGAWVLEDLGAKNGTLVNGVRVRHAELADGDVIELGGTFVVFRDAVAAVAGPPDGDAQALASALGPLTLSGELAAIYAGLAAVASTALPVLVHGATGTGKEVAARAVHAASGRRGPFVGVNCAAIPAQLVESELFGARKGAFTGAVADRDGHVRSADGGSLFLDEIAELPAAAQAALLRVLQEREVTPVGDSRPVRVDVRVIAASHVELSERVRTGTFRADLFARLDGFRVALPALADRREDLGLLVAAALARAGSTAVVAPAAARALFAYGWPGNVRELEMALARASALAGGRVIEPAHLPPSVTAAGASSSEPAAASPEDAALRDQLVAALARHAGNVTSIARELGKARWQIHRWMKRFDLDPARFREGA